MYPIKFSKKRLDSYTFISDKNLHLPVMQKIIRIFHIY